MTIPSNGHIVTGCSSATKDGYIKENNVWDEDTQTPHGGQEWRCLTNYLEDFSVTTNPLGTPKAALAAAAAALQNVMHYPAANCEPAITDLARFLVGDEGGDVGRLRQKLLLGNGASECIDLCCRMEGSTTWRPGPWLVQYKEYERSCSAWGKAMLPADDDTAGLLCLVNPCNPTGEFLPVDEAKQYIEKRCGDGTNVVVDESMLPWIGPHWRKESLISQGEWVESLLKTRGIGVYVIHSWTKLWSCPGLRLGSVVTPTKVRADALRKTQVPWSVNSMALAFLSEVVKDRQYLNDSWEKTAKWRQYIEDGVKQAHPDWEVGGCRWLTFLWINVKSEAVAKKCVNVCLEAGVPVRDASQGYGLPTYIRIGVRKTEEADVLLAALRLT